MDWQQLISLAIVVGAAGLLVWGKIRPRKFGVGKDAHCGCSAAASSPPQGSIIFHARKGQRSEVLLKMR